MKTSRKNFDSSEYYRAKNSFDGFCLGCGKKIGFSKYLILTKKGDLRAEPLPNKLIVCDSHCERLFIKKTIKDWCKVREQVLARDDYACQDCHKSYNPLEVHHIIPISEGGPEFELGNLVTLCFECHHLGRHGSKAPTPEEVEFEGIQSKRSQHICLDKFSEAA